MYTSTQKQMNTCTYMSTTTTVGALAVTEVEQPALEPPAGVEKSWLRAPSSTRQLLPFKIPRIPSNRDQKALNTASLRVAPPKPGSRMPDAPPSDEAPSRLASTTQVSGTSWLAVEASKLEHDSSPKPRKEIQHKLSCSPCSNFGVYCRAMQITSGNSDPGSCLEAGGVGELRKLANLLARIRSMSVSGVRRAPCAQDVILVRER